MADGVSHHFGQLASEGPLPLLDALPREDVIFEDQVMRDRGGDDHKVGPPAVNAAWSSPVLAGFNSPL